MEGLDLGIIFNWLIAILPSIPFVEILQALGSLVVMATVVVRFTPKTTDDVWLDKALNHPTFGFVFKFLKSHSLILRKGEEVKDKK